MVCGAPTDDHGKMRRSGQVLSAGKRKKRGSRLTGDDTDDWEAAFQEFMVAEDDDVEPFLAAGVKQDRWRSPATARTTRRRVGPSHPYCGIRQRPWGRWSAEIRDSTQGARVWIGTFDTAAQAAHAYDAEARRIHGAKAKTNFPADTAAAAVPYSESSCSTVDGGADNTDHAMESASSSSSKEVDGSHERILLECCSDDLMESLLACSDINMSSGSPVSRPNETCTGELFVDLLPGCVAMIS